MGAALAAVAGVMYLMYYGVVSFSDGFVPGVKAFTAAVLGGIGSLPGAVLGGLLIGLIETMWSAYFSIDYKDVAAFSILAIVLIFLPQGILGKPEVEKGKDLVSSKDDGQSKADVGTALKQAGIAGLVSLGMFGPLIGLLTEQNMSNQLVVTTRIPLLVSLVLIIMAG
eukprot:gene14712-19892_t